MNVAYIWSRARLWAQDLLFPPTCVGCGRALPPAKPETGIFCPTCRTQWEKDCTEARLSIGGVLPEALSVGGCSRHLYLTGYHPGRPQGASERLIYHIKRENDRRVFTFLAEAMFPYLLEAFPQTPPDQLCFAFAPRRRRAVIKHGLDQSERLAQELAKVCGGTAVPLLVRHGGREQKKLTAHQRKKNVAAIFSLKEEYRDEVAGKTVVLVDDLLTTGATLGLCSSLLASAGAFEIVALTVAKTMEREDHERKKQRNRRHRRWRK